MTTGSCSLAKGSNLSMNQHKPNFMLGTAQAVIGNYSSAIQSTSSFYSPVHVIDSWYTVDDASEAMTRRATRWHMERHKFMTMCSLTWQLFQHIKSHLLELGWHVVEDQFEAQTPVGMRQFTNLVAVLDPRSRSRLTLACHYDSKQFDNDVMESFIGATDAAASCAMIINLVTCLNESLHESRRKMPPPEVSTCPRVRAFCQFITSVA
jgi:hypothetical protein